MNKIVWSIVAFILLITLVLEFTFLSGYDSHWWNSIPAFYALFGIASCLTIIYVAKFIAKKIVNRDIHYYD